MFEKQSGHDPFDAAQSISDLAAVCACVRMPLLSFLFIKTDALAI
jgi:hypothetical protein